jgi:PAS domain S-box-containing protein
MTGSGELSSSCEGDMDTMNSDAESDGRLPTVAELTEEQLRLVLESVRLFIEGAVDYAFLMLDPTGSVAIWNIGAERLTGYAAADVYLQPFAIFYSEPDRRGGIPATALEIALRDGKSDGESWVVRKNGTRFWASIVIYRMPEHAGKPSAFAAVIRDISERLRQQDELERAHAAFGQAQKMETLGRLTGGIAHDFNNILTSILGCIDLLERRADFGVEDRRRLLATTRHAAERGTALTQRLLAFSRRHVPEATDVDVNLLVARLADFLRRTLGEAIEIETVLADDTWPVYVDANQFETALLNLAINASDAMPSGGRLVIETRNVQLGGDAPRSDAETGDFVLITASDTGQGMSEETRVQAFDPFFTTKPQGQGTGLGLSQVLGFANESGGKIMIESEPRAGTTAKLYLPRLDAAAVRAREGQDRAKAAMRDAAETVLFVDDDEDIRDYVRSALEVLGYRAIVASGGSSALLLLDEHPEVSLLFTAVAMRGMNGRELAEEALKRAPGLKVLYTTGYARAAVLKSGLVETGDDLIMKPFTIDVLSRKLRDVLQR